MKNKFQGLDAIPTMQKKKIRSMPKTEGQDYLDLYILEKEKNRLKQEEHQAKKRSKQVEEGLKFAEEEIGRLEKELPERSKETREGKGKKKDEFKKRLPKKPFKVMKLDY